MYLARAESRRLQLVQLGRALSKIVLHELENEHELARRAEHLPVFHAILHGTILRSLGKKIHGHLNSQSDNMR